MHARALVLLALLGCGGGDKEEAAGGGDSPAKATPRDAVVEAWKKGGLEPSALTAATVAFGKDCQAATVKNVDVLLCNYGSADEAKQAEPASTDWIKGAPTATAFVSGNVLVVIADNKKADPAGKTINQLMKLAPKG
jgi:hypothetical protein